MAVGDQRVIKIVIIALVGSLLLAAVIATQDRDVGETTRPEPTGIRDRDGFDAELERCRALGPNDPADARCSAAWAESHRRFFGGDRGRK